MVQGVSWAALLSLSLWVPGQGLTGDAGQWLSEGVPNPSPASLEDFIFCWLLLGPFPQWMVFGILFRSVKLMNLMLILSHPFNIQEIKLNL